jgi:ferredoxin-NADP reductase/predicted pyridoxine 5'-phosphate oxidase superfamily flavin-nucleotide-binding protein
MHADGPFHPGEIAIQQRLGVAERMAEFGRRVVRDHMPDQHRQFYAQLPFLVVAAVDDQGRPWASLIEGRPGFAHSPEPRTLQLALAPAADDPAAAGWHEGAAVGALGVELPTRRRNRVNGRLGALAQGGWQLQVEHAFGNCPQYIHARGIEFAFEPGAQPPGERLCGQALGAEAIAMIRAAETFFVASYVDDADGGRAVDASHRGGKPGFVRVDGQRLSVPDFAGNLHFNTLGNFLLNPRAGLLFLDFASGDVLQLTGSVQLALDAGDARHFQGAERVWHVDVEHWVLRRGALALRGDAGQASMNSQLTGSWEEAAARGHAQTLRGQWRRYRIARIERESDSVRSFWLEPADGAGLAPFEAGQHLPVRARIDGEWLQRSYTLSVSPADGGYRISVRRQGRFSAHLHDALAVGDTLEAQSPRGQFGVDAGARRPLVLLSAGIGITPMLAMLRQVVFEGLRTRRTRPTWFVHGARTLRERAFAAEVAALAARTGGAVTVLQALSAPEPEARLGSDYQLAGRIGIEVLRSIPATEDGDYVLCGPPDFMRALYRDLRALGVPDARIHAEAFGPAALARDTPAGPAVATRPLPVQFARSGREARWTPGSGSLLELAESLGLNPAHACRQGICGSCSHALHAGQVSYPLAPPNPVAPGQVLLCQAMPAEASGPLVVDA